MPIMQNLDSITALLQKLEPKDVLTLIISLFSLVLAGTAFFYTVFSKRRQLAISIRNNFHTSILKLSENKVHFASLHRELGGDYHNVHHPTDRSPLVHNPQ